MKTNRDNDEKLKTSFPIRMSTRVFYEHYLPHAQSGIGEDRLNLLMKTLAMLYPDEVTLCGHNINGTPKYGIIKERKRQKLET